MTATKRTGAYMPTEPTDVSTAETSMTAAKSTVRSTTTLCPQRYREHQHKCRNGRQATHSTTL
jgi:hypothetical protein